MSYSKIESARFGKSVHRFRFEEIDGAAIKAIRAAKPDIAIVRFPSSRIDQLSKLELFGVAPLATDTLVYYECDLERLEPREVANQNLGFEVAGPGEREQLADLVAQVFEGYTNHYAGNPLLSKADILEGYVEWGLSFLQDGNDLVCWVLYDGDRPVALANCKVAGGVFEGVLYGVHREYSGRGVYGDLISLTQRAAVERGCKTMVVSTQIQNLAVQRAWVRRGFRLVRSDYTVHLNLLLSEETDLASVEEEVRVDEELVQQFGRLVGDENPVHFDDCAAKEVGFDGRVAHGAILNGFLSKLLGMRLPGPGTIYLAQRSFYLRPVYPGQSVRIVVRIKHVHPGSGRMLASTSIYNSGGKLVFAGQAQVLNREFASRLESRKSRP